MKLRIAMLTAICALLVSAPAAFAVNDDNVVTFSSPDYGAYVNAVPTLQWEADGDLDDASCQLVKSGNPTPLFDAPCDDAGGPILRGDIGDPALGQNYFGWDLTTLLATPGDGDYSVVFTPSWTNPPDNGPASFAFTLDRIAPTVTVAGPSGVFATKTPEGSFSVVDLHPGTSYCAVDPADPNDPGDYTACPSTDFDLPAMPDGDHEFYVRHVDLAGNVGTNHKSFTTDATPPSLSVGGLANGAQLTTSNPTFTVTVSDAGVGGATATCSYDGQPPVSCSSPVITAASLADGPHTLKVEATDAIGNSVSQTIGFTVGTSIPVELVPRTATFARAKVKVKGAKVSFTATGAFAVPGALSPATACKGTATLALTGKLKGKKAKTWRKRVKLRAKGATCVTAPATFKLPRTYKGKPLTAKLSFGGNGAVGAFDKNGKIKKL